jgi:putative membrane protein
MRMWARPGAVAGAAWRPVGSLSPVHLPSIAAQLARGFTMGTADLVPGVSGGTVALVLGIYERLIHNIRTGASALRQLVTGDWTAFGATVREIEWAWLLSLLGGILLAVAALSSVLERLLREEPVRMAALFFGLVLGAVWVAWRMLDRVDAPALALIIGIGAVMFLLLGLRDDTEVADDAAGVVTEPLWVFFLAGALAICAMILPGISGSFILVLIGMYTEVLGAVNDRDLVALGAFTIGCVVGLALFSTLLSWLLERYHNLVLAAMIGLMVGSMRVLWPWPGGTETTRIEAPSGDVVVPILLAVVGLVVVLAIERLGRQLTSDANRSMPSAMSSSPSANENRP